MGLERRLSETFSFCPEVGYVRRGVHTQVYNLGDLAIEGDVHLDYIEVPLLFKGNVITSRKFNLFLLAGPTAAIALRREATVFDMVAINVADRFHWYDLTGQFGLGMDYRIYPDLIFQGMVRYTAGFVDLSKESFTYKTRAIQLLLGLRFGF